MAVKVDHSGVSLLRPEPVLQRNNGVSLVPGRFLGRDKWAVEGAMTMGEQQKVVRARESRVRVFAIRQKEGKEQPEPQWCWWGKAQQQEPQKYYCTNNNNNDTTLRHYYVTGFISG